MAWFYVSGVRGGVFAQGADERAAMGRASALGVELPSSVMVLGPVPDAAMDSHVPEEMRERLLSAEEVVALDPAVVAPPA